MCGRSEGVREVEDKEGARNTACDPCALFLKRVPMGGAPHMQTKHGGGCTF